MYKITLVALTCLLMACQAQPVEKVITQTVVTERNIVIPNKIIMDELYTGIEFNTVIDSCETITTSPNVCIELSIEDYEKLGLNMQTILKHSRQQDAQIDYYRNSLTTTTPTP